MAAKITRSLLESYTLPDLHRLQWFTRVVMTIGVLASGGANVLHANPNIISQIIAAWPVAAFLLAVELALRIPIAMKLRAAVRIPATAVVAGIAFWVSYQHMVDVAIRYGEAESTAVLLPISVDGLILIASVSMLEVGAYIKERVLATLPPPPAPAEPAVDSDAAPAKPTGPTPPAPAVVEPTEVADADGAAEPELVLAGAPSSNGHSRGQVASAKPAKAVKPKAAPSRTGPRERYQKDRDDELIALLREEAAKEPDGKLGVRQASRITGLGVNPARRLLDIAGLRRETDRDE